MWKFIDRKWISVEIHLCFGLDVFHINLAVTVHQPWHENVLIRQKIKGKRLSHEIYSRFSCSLTDKTSKVPLLGFMNLHMSRQRTQEPPWTTIEYVDYETQPITFPSKSDSIQIQITASLSETNIWGKGHWHVKRKTKSSVKYQASHLD